MIKHLLVAAMIAGATAPAAPAAAQPDRTLERVLQAIFEREVGLLAATIARQALNRARRSFALGPFAGAGGSISQSGDAPDLVISGGLALTRYDIDIVVSPDELVRQIKERALKRLLERYVVSGASTEDEFRALVREVLEEVKRDLLRGVAPRRFEPPGFKLALEVGHTLDAEATDIALSAGLGIGPIFATVGIAGRIDDDFAVILPVEVSLPMLLSDSLRSPAVEWFGRVEVPLREGDLDLENRFVLGARISLDVI